MYEIDEEFWDLIQVEFPITGLESEGIRLFRSGQVPLQYQIPIEFLDPRFVGDVNSEV